MFRQVWISGLCFVVCTVSGCRHSNDHRVVGSGNVVTTTPRVEAFDSVRLVGVFRVDLTIGESPSLAITTDDNVMPLIQARVAGGVLTVELGEKVKPSDANTIKITNPTLREFSSTGAIKASIKQVAGPSFTIGVEGAGSVNLTGRSEKLSLKVEGAGKIGALGLKAKAVDVRVDGTGSVDTHAIETLDITLNGIGVVRYRGDPKLTKSVSGLGTVRKM